MSTRIGFLTMAAATAVTGGWILAAANPANAQTVVHVRTADLKASDTANVKIEPVRWYGGTYYHTYYRPPYRAYYGAPYRAYYGGPYRAYYGGAYRAWYGNPYSFYPYPAYPYYYGPRYYNPYPYAASYAPYAYPAVGVATPYGGFYW